MIIYLASALLQYVRIVSLLLLFQRLQARRLRYLEDWIRSAPQEFASTMQPDADSPESVLELLLLSVGTPNIFWRSMPIDHLRSHPLYDALPRSGPSKIDNSSDLRLFPQDSWQWAELHHGRQTTRHAASTSGILEPKAAAQLGVPRSLCGHDRALGAYESLKGVIPMEPEHWLRLLEDDVGASNEAREDLNIWIIETNQSKMQARYLPRQQFRVQNLGTVSVRQARMAWGSTQEATAILVAINYFGSRGGRVAEVGLCIDDKTGLGASPDGIVFDGDGSAWSLEVKNHAPFQYPRHDLDAAKANLLTVADRAPTKSVSPWYLPQLALEAHCLGDLCAGTVLVRLTATRGAVILRLRRNTSYEEKLVQLMGRFRKEFVSPCVQPPCDFWHDDPSHKLFIEATKEYAASAEVMAVVSPQDIQRAGDFGEKLLFS